MQKDKQGQWVVITDLDGTLLSHHDYQWHAALPAIAELRKRNISIIFNTSKTYHETVQIQKMLNLDMPFIVENGSCLYLPKSQYTPEPVCSATSRDDFWQIVLGKTFDEIESALDLMKMPDDAYTRLSRCEPDEVSHLTGLTELQANDAIKREFSEPVIWKKSEQELTEFKNQLKQLGLTTLQGGRFLHILGNCDKAMAIDELSTYFPDPVKTIVLGDSANDFEMLIHADIPIVIQSPGNRHLLQLMTPPYITGKPAPDGWTEGIEYALDKIQDEE